MKYIDVHAHLDMSRFDEDREDVIQKAKENEICILSSGVNPDANRKVLEYSKKYDNVLCSFGVYPIDAIIKDFPNIEDDGSRKIKSFELEDELNWIKDHRKECVLIGEIGMDFKVVDTTDEIKKMQIKNFERILEFSKEIDKPVLIHSRGAELECIELLEKHGCKKVIMHCFSGKKSLIKRIVDNGWFLSIPAVITRLEHFQMVAKIVPLTQILTETDAPYLSPIVGERNDSTSILITIKQIAKIKEISEKSVSKQILKNAKLVLNLS